MRLALAPKIAVVEEDMVAAEDAAVVKEDMVAAEDAAVVKEDMAAAAEVDGVAVASNHRHSTHITMII
jgi:hypothetical protein